MRVVQFCPDDQISSGINKFCTELDLHLRGIGVDSRILREYDPEALERWPGGGERSRSTLPEGGAVIHIHDMWLPAVHKVAVWAQNHKVPVVWSTHGMTSKWSMRHKRWKKLPAWWLYQKRDLQRATAIHCTTDLEVEWNKYYGFENCFTAPLGTYLPDSGAARESACDTVDRAFRVLFVGRIYPVKGLMNLVRAVAILKLNGSHMTFRLVGPDQGGHMEELKSLCRELAVDNVEFAGEKTGVDLAAEYDACDVLVLPSFTENFGGVVVDALAHGKPAITSKFTPWRELEAQGCGWWVDNSPESLAKMLVEVASLSREKLDQMGRRGRQLVEEKYTWEAVAKKMKSEYERVLGEV